MKRTFYFNKKEELITRDYLAIDRTIMSNERTLLAYVQLSLTLLVSGVSFLEFFEFQLAHLLSYIFMPTGVAALIIGFTRYYFVKKTLYKLLQGEKPDVPLKKSNSIK